jgi:hypothetical protein
MGILPPPPRAVGSGRLFKNLITVLFLALIGLGMLGGLGYYSFTIVDDLITDRAIFDSGVVAANGDVEGTSRARRAIFHEYKLTLRYTDKAGKRHVVKQEFDTVLGEVDSNAKVVIKYDPKHPDQAASSWSVDVTTSRAIWAVLAAAVGLCGGVLVFAALKQGRDAFLERVAARDGTEVRVSLTEKSRDRYGNVSYSFSSEIGPAQAHNGLVTLGGKRSPWWLAGNTALGLYSEKLRRVFVVESDGQPVLLGAPELGRSGSRRRSREGGAATLTVPFTMGRGAFVAHSKRKRPPGAHKTPRWQSISP